MDTKHERHIKILAANLKYLRKSRGKSQSDMADDLGMTQSTLCHYEKGQIVNPGMDMLLSISEFFDISVDDLLNKELEHFVPPVEQRIVSSTSAEDNLKYFCNLKLYLYFDGGTHGLLYGSLTLDREYDKQRKILRGVMHLAHDYDCILTVHQAGLQGICFYIYGMDIDDEQQRTTIVMYVPAFHATATDYSGGVGLFTHIDDGGSIVSQRILISDQKLEVDDDSTRSNIIDFLSSMTCKEHMIDYLYEDYIRIRKLSIDRLQDRRYVQWLREYIKRNPF